MSSPSLPVLQQLDHLDRALSGFNDQLCNVLYGEEYTRCVRDLRGDGLTWLVDYLDEVRLHITPPHLSLKQSQTLGGLDPSGAAFRKCLREFRDICGRGILPTSCTLSSHLLNMRSELFDSGGYGDVYKGSLDGSNVCIKRIRVYTKDGPEKAMKVRYRLHRFHYLPLPTKSAGLLSRGCSVETFDTPKHLAPPRYHH